MPNRSVENRNPATGELIGSYPLDTADDVRAAIERARVAQEAWARSPYRERSQALGRVCAALAARSDEMASIIGANNGKTRLDALVTEVLPAILALRYYRAQGKRLLASRRLGGGSILMFNKRSRLQRVPYGVVGVISPWNYPFAIPFSEVAMALLAGNAAILKVATDSLAVGKALAGLLEGAGLPEGLFAYVNLPGREAGEAFIEGGVDKLFFTGSTEVGRELMAKAAARLIPVVLELGGNDAAIVRADADLDRAAAGIVWSGFSNAGQSCGGAQRVFVERSVFDAFAAKLKARVEGLRTGPGSDFDIDMGCMTSARQKKTVEDQVARSLDMGAKVLARSPLDPELEKGNFLPAIVLGEAPPDSPVMREEVFGPVVAVLPYEGEDEALRLANDSALGLTASVWSRDRRTARALASRLHAGAVTINDHLMSHGLAETPWGGFGDSGIGRTHAELGFLEMLQTRVVVDDVLPGVKKDLWWQPYSERVYRGHASIIALVAGQGLFARLKGLFGVLRLFLRYWDRS
jgi:succinate-semialdehyde dehydrogenase/glutarate-semialdehyde dehydrogenase